MKNVIVFLLLVFVIMSMYYISYYSIIIDEQPVNWESFQNEKIKNGWVDDYFDKVFVITLPKRKNNVKKIMKKMKIEPIIFDAIDKNTLDLDKLKKQNKVSEVCKMNNGRIACHLSHLKVMETFLKDPKAKNALIFEDDLQPPRDMYEIKNTIHNVITTVPDDWDLIYFGKCWDDCRHSKKINEYIYKSHPLCRHGYAVSRKGAKKLLKECFPIVNIHGDEHIKKLSQEGKVNIYTSEPSIFFQNREQLGTTLGNHGLLKLCSNM